MRRVICALTVLALASPAFAADLDLDILRGSQPVGPATFTRWSGFYLGGQLSYSDANVDFLQRDTAARALQFARIHA